MPSISVFGTVALLAVPVDGNAIAVLRAQAGLGEHGGAGAGEHSIEAMLPLLQRALRPGWMLVPVLVGSADPGAARAVAEALRPFADDDTLVVASGDLTHYGQDYDYLPFPLTPALPAKLAALDRGFYDRILDLDPGGLAAYRDRTSINACGYGPFLVLASLLSHDVRPVLLRYETSGANTGSFASSVSYAAMAFSGPRAPRNAGEALPRREMKVLLDLAVRAIDRAVRTGSTVDPAALRAPGPIDARLEADGASFITLTRRGEMRGCVGDLEAREPLWRSVVHTAVQAALRDVRFDPVRPQELAALEVEVSVVGPLRPIASPAEIRLGADGVLLKEGLRTGAFLPEVPVQQGWSLEMLLDALAAKAEIPRHAWRNGVHLQVFVTQTLSGRIGR